MTRAPVSEGNLSAPPLAKPYLPWGFSLGLRWGHSSLDSLTGRGPELVLWDQLQRKPSSQRPWRPFPPFREGIIS